MRLVVASCWKYRDSWEPFMALFRRYWPDFNGHVHLLTDEVEWSFVKPLQDRYQFMVGHSRPSTPWCQVLTEYCDLNGDPFLMMQEDFLINAPVRTDLIGHAMNWIHRENIGAVRIYPVPGATDASDDPYFGLVARGTAYRTSCQATIWKPSYLGAVARHFETAADFEIQGSVWASKMRGEEVLAWKREVEPWPIEYLCSAITRGKWTRDAVLLCEAEGVDLDLSRGIQ